MKNRKATATRSRAVPHNAPYSLMELNLAAHDSLKIQFNIFAQNMRHDNSNLPVHDEQENKESFDTNCGHE